MCTNERQEGEDRVRRNPDECASESGCRRTDRVIAKASCETSAGAAGKAALVLWECAGVCMLGPLHEGAPLPIIQRIAIKRVNDSTDTLR